MFPEETDVSKRPIQPTPVSEIPFEYLTVEMRSFLYYLNSLFPEDLVVTSLWRDSGEHSTGMAVDIGCIDSKARFSLVTHALSLGVERIGVYDRHVHFGLSPDFPRPVMWTGISKKPKEG